MKIETKFEVGQTVYFMEHNRIVLYDIHSISIVITKDKLIDLAYIFLDAYEPSRTFGMGEERLFASKEDLLKSL